MDFKRRKLSAHEIKKDFGDGGAWKDGLVTMVEDYCDVKIDDNIAGMIYDYTLGWWEDCIECGEKTNGPFSECKYKWDGIDYYCNQCKDSIKDPSSEYPFDDD